MSVTTDQLVRDHIDAGGVASRARLRESGVPVWSIIGYLRMMDGDTTRVARAFRVPVEAIEAALAYYQRHEEAIDARLLINSE